MFMMWLRWTLPRLRIDQVMTTCLKYCVPLASIMLAGTMLWMFVLRGGISRGGRTGRKTPPQGEPADQKSIANCKLQIANCKLRKNVVSPVLAQIRSVFQFSFCNSQIAICNFFNLFPVKELATHVGHPLGQFLLPVVRLGDVRLGRGRGGVGQHRAHGRLPGRSLCGVAGLFFLAGAEFLGAMQLMVYVGGTVVLLVFGVMLTARGPFVSMHSSGGQWILALLAGGALLAVLLQTVRSGSAGWRSRLRPQWARPRRIPRRPSWAPA